MTNGNGATVDETGKSEHITAIEQAAGKVMQAAAEKLIDQSGANIQAAEEALRMLKENHEALISEVRRLAENHAKRLSEYLTTVHLATTVMATHREALMAVAGAVASEQITVNQ